MYTTMHPLRIRVPSSPAVWLLYFVFVMDEGDVELEAIPQSLIADIAAQYPGLKALNLSGNSKPHHTAHPIPCPLCSHMHPCPAKPHPVQCACTACLLQHLAPEGDSALRQTYPLVQRR